MHFLRASGSERELNVFLPKLFIVHCKLFISKLLLRTTVNTNLPQGIYSSSPCMRGQV